MESKGNNNGHQKIMMIGITVIMVAVAVLWVFNIQSFISPYSERLLVADQDEFSWKDIRGRFDKTMSQVVGKMNELEAKKELAANLANASSSLDNLEAVLNNKLGASHSSSSVVSTSSSSALGVMGTSSDFQLEDLRSRLDSIEKSLNKK
ncbi:MAG: hypothetical protein WC564_01690 [Patescibacteria group bacterium]|jgi:hypothetical protein